MRNSSLILREYNNKEGDDGICFPTIIFSLWKQEPYKSTYLTRLIERKDVLLKKTFHFKQYPYHVEIFPDTYFNLQNSFHSIQLLLHGEKLSLLLYIIHKWYVCDPAFPIWYFSIADHSFFLLPECWFWLSTSVHYLQHSFNTTRHITKAEWTLFRINGWTSVWQKIILKLDMCFLKLSWFSVSFSNGISLFASFLCFKCNHVQTLTRTFAYVLTLVNDELQALLMENLWSSYIIVPKKARIRVFVLLRNKVGPLPR